METQDFNAKLKYRTTEEGGRNGYAASGYRPHIEFDNYPECLTSGSQTFINKEKVYPGDTVDAKINIIGTEYFTKRLYIGKKFKFCEGSRVIGTGEITEVVNKELKIESNQDEKDFNINLFSKDIIDKIRYNHGDDFGRFLRIIQPFLLEQVELRSPRIVRSIIYVTNRNIEKLEEHIKITKTDYRDILLIAEYELIKEKDPKRVRNFNNEFGNEQL